MSAPAIQQRATSADTRHGCLAGRSTCTRPVVAEVTAMCIHEHFRTGPICAHHKPMLGAPRGLTCRECLEHPTSSHEPCFLRSVAS
jgi:hypothetical protein